MAQFVVVRPYDARIREQVFAHLKKAGITPDPSVRIPPGTEDDEAIERLRGVKNRVLLIPFHGHRDEAGNFVNGLLFARKLARAAPELNAAPILMPVSRFAAGAAHLLWEVGVNGEKIAPELKERILLIEEEDLLDENLPFRVRDHLEKVAGTKTIFTKTA
jgi:hypothetical protein